MIKYFCKNCNINVESSECSVCGARTEVESKLYWCSNCNIPVYDEVCPICGCKGEYFTSDARPVFPEERLLIEIMLGKPFCFIEDSVWNGSGNRYYVNGKKIPFSVTNLKNYDPSAIREKLDELKSQNTYEHFDRMIAQWVKANAIRYDYITSEAKSYIAQYSKKYLNDDLNAAFVSFSGGKDSTVVSDLVRKATGNPSIIHIFGNTTLEFPQTYEYVERFRATNKRTPMLRAENKEQDFFNLCETFGPPSRTLRWCCTIFKTGFIGEKIKKTFSGRKTVLTFYGIRRNESASRNTYERSSQGKKITQQLVASPIIDWMDYILLDFAIKMGKENPEEYVSNGGWKARQGGAGIELSKNVAIAFKPCATDAKSFNYVLNKPISDDLYEFFKPFGVLDFTMGKERLGEVYILDFKTKLPIMKLQGRRGMNELKITILSTPIAGKTKINEIELKFKCQITKYQLCAGCHACENACKHSAIRLIKDGEGDTKYKYLIDETKCVHCFECINHYTGGCYMRRVLLPRGKGYSDDK